LRALRLQPALPCTCLPAAVEAPALGLRFCLLLVAPALLPACLPPCCMPWAYSVFTTTLPHLSCPTIASVKAERVPACTLWNSLDLLLFGTCCFTWEAACCHCHSSL